MVNEGVPHSSFDIRHSKLKKGIAITTMPPMVFAGDPAPQQLTAPCRKYSGRLHLPIEQAVYPLVFLGFLAVFVL